MSEQPEFPTEPRPERYKEFEDPRFHDDDHLIPPDDVDRPGCRPPAANPTGSYPPDVITKIESQCEKTLSNKR